MTQTPVLMECYVKNLELLIISCDDFIFLLFMEAQNLIPDKVNVKPSHSLYVINAVRTKAAKATALTERNSVLSPFHTHFL